MNPEQRKVLELLVQGSVTVLEAGRLIEKLNVRRGAGNGVHPNSNPPSQNSADSSSQAPSRPASGRPAGESVRRRGDPASARRFLRISVKSACGEHVNLRIPLPFLRAGVRLSALIPEKIQQILQKKGILLNSDEASDPEAFIRNIADLELHLGDAAGEEIRFYCE